MHQLTIDHITKEFAGVTALRDVSFAIRPHHVTALMGENGAGKSTLLSILGGEQRPSKGRVLLDDVELRVNSPGDARSAGIQIVHQEPHLVMGLTVAENVLIGRLPHRASFVRRGLIEATCREVIDRMGISLDPRAIVGALGSAQRQMVEIVKGLVNDAKVLALDEPTSSLASAEAEQLFNVIETLRREGVAVIYVSHRMDEVLRLADSFVVLRDGQVAGVRERSNVDESSLIELMIGRTLSDMFPTPNHRSGEVVLRLRQAATKAVGPIDLETRRGEVVGLAGLVGAGRSRVVRMLCGADPLLDGCIEVGGRRLRFGSPQDAIAAGIATCPEDRKKLALIPDRSVSDNIVMGVHSVERGILRRHSAEREIVDLYIRRLSLRPPDPRRLVRTLSGGNAQKVVLARALAHQPQVLILDEPTRGIDVGAKSEIYAIIRALAESGVSVIVSSSDLAEVLGLSDRIYVLRAGVVVGELSRSQATQDLVTRLAFGLSVDHDEIVS
jgi:ABC-type sugar transport system ATPase subunit